MARTLFELVRDWARDKDEQVPLELRIFNPAQARIGDFMSLQGVPELLEMDIKNPQVKEINAATVLIGNQEFKHTDYILYEGDQWVCLRVDPMNDANPEGIKQAHVLLLFLDYGCEYDEGLHSILGDKPFEVRDGEGKIVATYERNQGVKDPYVVKLETAKGFAQFAEIEELDMWDFVRTKEDGSVEFYFVEMNKETGWFQMFRGIEISDTSVFHIPTDHEK